MAPLFYHYREIKGNFSPFSPGIIPLFPTILGQAKKSRTRVGQKRQETHPTLLLNSAEYRRILPQVSIVSWGKIDLLRVKRGVIHQKMAQTSFLRVSRNGDMMKLCHKKGDYANILHFHYGSKRCPATRFRVSIFSHREPPFFPFSSCLSVKTNPYSSAKKMQIPPDYSSR